MVGNHDCGGLDPVGAGHRGHDGFHLGQAGLLGRRQGGADGHMSAVTGRAPRDQDDDQDDETTRVARRSGPRQASGPRRYFCSVNSYVYGP
jgi:hypothetical protein